LNECFGIEYFIIDICLEFDHWMLFINIKYMFNFFKKKEIGNKTVKEAKKEEYEKKEEEYEDKINKNIAVHVMPEKFRFVNPQSQKAKRAGSAIIISGIVFIIVASILVYFYFFNSTEKKEEPLNKDSETYTGEKSEEFSDDKQESPGKDSGSTTTEEGLPTLIEPDTSTTTDKIMEPEIDFQATSTLPGTIVTNEDSDGDGLFDKEEILLGCSSSMKDSDRDGYDDLTELINFYNPTGKGRLVDNENILEYYNKTFGYNVYYPLGWQKINMGGEDSVMFKSDDNSFFQIIVRPNVDNQLVDDWYKQQFELDEIDEGKIIDTDSWHGLKSDDELVVYLSDIKNEYLFVLTYGPEVDDALIYKNIFDMFIKSFNIES